MRHLTLFALLLTILGILASPAQACLNDRETGPRETEFKAQYSTPSIAPEASAPDSAETPTYIVYLLMGAGGLLGMTGLGMGGAVGFMALRKSA